MARKKETKEVLVGILIRKSSLEILKTERWYHIPVEKARKEWPPKILAFYQGYPFGDEAFQIRYFGEVDQIEIVPRKELFPNDERNKHKAEKLYYRLSLKKLREREKPILSYRPRAWAFISTTMTKFENAEQVNDLYVGSALEERLWKALKYTNILAEREWKVKIQDHTYYLDFAVFCKTGKLAIETDGYSYHYDSKTKIDYDTWRQNEIEIDDWHFLHYTTKQVKDNRTPYLAQIQTKIEQLGGPESPEEFNRKIGEEQAEYLVDDVDDDENYD
jgi:very-short-patch-repair endonuclease